MALDERDFFDEKNRRRRTALPALIAASPNDYEVNWLVRTKKRQNPSARRRARSR